MILQALTDYYQRMAEDDDADVPEFGFGQQGVHFCLTLDRQGSLVGNPMDLRDEKGKAKRIEVPGPVNRTAGVSSNFAWDNTGYVLGADDKGKPERTAQTCEAFRELCSAILAGIDDEGAQALLAFFEKWKPSEAENLTYWDEMVGWNVVFKLDDENRFLHDRPAFREAWVRHLESADPDETGMCLVTGENGVTIPNTHASVKGVLGAQSSGAALISFNFDAAVSFGKKQNLNAPVSDRAAFAYTTALNYLLAPGSERKIQIGDTTMVFWTDAPRDNQGDAEAMFSFAMGGKQAEDEELTLRLEKHMASIVRAKLPDELGNLETRFYILGLSPNAARLSVRFWHVGTIGDMAANLGAHFQALALKRNFDNEPEHPSPWWILKELAPRQDSRNMSPLLSGQLLQSILKKQPYPRTLLTAAIGRIRADKQVNYLRAATIKAYLVRNEKQEIHMALDTENTNIGYRLGRLFAIVERIQDSAVPGANATVRDRFFSSASATPARTFPIILRNAQHGLAKVRKDTRGWAIHLDSKIEDIVGGIEATAGFPATLNLEDQGMFILGYYQQRQDLFTKKEDKTEE